MTSAVVLALVGGTLAEPAPASRPTLPARVRFIVLHTLGGPFYGRPEMRWVFLPPAETLARWTRPRFGAHWIVWTDGSIWSRHPAQGEAASFLAPEDPSLAAPLAARIAREAAPVYSHVAGHNSSTLGIEVAHSGRSDDPFPDAQARATAWLVSSLLDLSGGRLSPGAVVGHKDLDRKPAFVGDRCRGSGCLAYVDPSGRPFRRRVDPPEELFSALLKHGLAVPRAGTEGDTELRRSLAIPRNEVPRTQKP